MSDNGMTMVKEQVTLTFGSTDDPFEITGDVYRAAYAMDGSLALEFLTDEGAEHLTVNLSSHGLIPDLGSVFVKNQGGPRVQSMVDAGLGTITRTVTYGPFNSTATEIALEV